MSRSRKRIPIVKDYSRTSTRFQKRRASKAVRRWRGPIPDGKFYRKIFCSWEIFDHIWYADWWDDEDMKQKAFRK